MFCSCGLCSVVVVSRGRVADLPLCLIGLSQLDYPSFEIVLVADPEGIAAVQVLDFVDQVKQVTFDEPNISAARNLGIAQAAGDIVAFIDDDAVAEPTWLTHLMKGFEQPEVACAGGFVIGRSISVGHPITTGPSRITTRMARKMPFISLGTIVCCIV